MKAVVCRELLDAIRPEAIAEAHALEEARACEICPRARVERLRRHSFREGSDWTPHLMMQELVGAIPAYVGSAVSALRAESEAAAEAAARTAAAAAPTPHRDEEEEGDDAADGDSARAEAPPAVPATRLELALADAAIAALSLLCRLAAPAARRARGGEGGEGGGEAQEPAAASAQEGQSATTSAAQLALWETAAQSLKARARGVVCPFAVTRHGLT